MAQDLNTLTPWRLCVCVCVCALVHAVCALVHALHSPCLLPRLKWLPLKGMAMAYGPRRMSTKKSDSSASPQGSVNRARQGDAVTKYRAEMKEVNNRTDAKRGVKLHSIRAKGSQDQHSAATDCIKSRADLSLPFLLTLTFFFFPSATPDTTHMIVWCVSCRCMLSEETAAQSDKIGDVVQTDNVCVERREGV